MGVDVVHRLGGGASVRQGLLHTGGAPGPCGVGGGDVVGVAGGAVAGDLTQDLSAASAGVLQFLQHQNGGTLAHDEAAALRVKGDGGPGRVRGSGQGAHGGEAANGQGGDRGLRAASHHDLGISVPDVAEGVA